MAIPPRQRSRPRKPEKTGQAQTLSQLFTAHISRAAVWQENAIDLERLGIGMIGSFS